MIDSARVTTKHRPAKPSFPHPKQTPQSNSGESHHSPHQHGPQRAFTKGNSDSLCDKQAQEQTDKSPKNGFSENGTQSKRRFPGESANQPMTEHTQSPNRQTRKINPTLTSKTGRPTQQQTPTLLTAKRTERPFKAFFLRTATQNIKKQKNRL